MGPSGGCDVGPSAPASAEARVSSLKAFQDITEPALAKALAHPLRTRILAALEDRTASPSELADEEGATLGVTSYHVRRLESLGLVKLVKRTPRRGAVEHYYRATARPRITSDAWGSAPAIVKQATISAAFDQVGQAVAQAVEIGGFDHAESHLTRSPLTVDQEGWNALAAELDRLQERIGAIEVESRQRLARSDEAASQRATVVLMLFNSPTADQPARPTAARQGKPSRRTKADSRPTS